MMKSKIAHTLTEFLITFALVIILITSTVGAFVLIKHIFASDTMAANLQRDANLIMEKILKGKRESTGIFRLSEAFTYRIVSISELHFTGTDGIERWFRLGNTSTSVIYHHPTAAGTTDETIYTAPSGATITLRFSIPVGPQYSGVVVGIDVAILQNKNISGAIKTVSSSASTYVNIRNHAV